MEAMIEVTEFEWSVATAAYILHQSWLQKISFFYKYSLSLQLNKLIGSPISLSFSVNNRIHSI
jgi:hypothetical protein